MKRAAIQKIGATSKKKKTSKQFLDEDNDAYKTEENAYILPWHNVNLGDDEYKKDFYKKELTISSDSVLLATKNISNIGAGELNWIKKNLKESIDTFVTGITINEEGIKVVTSTQNADIQGMGLMDDLEDEKYFTMLPFFTEAYKYDRYTAFKNKYGKYFRFQNTYTVTKNEFIIKEDPKTKRMQLYKLTEAGRIATNQNTNFDSGPVPNWEKVSKLRQDLTFYRYTNSHASKRAKIIQIVQAQGKYRFSKDRLPVDIPLGFDEDEEIKSYNKEMSWTEQKKYNILTDERKFTVSFTMEILQVNHFTESKPSELKNQENTVIHVLEYDSNFIKSQLPLLNSHFWRGAHFVPTINDGDYFYQIQLRPSHILWPRTEFCLQLRGDDLNDIVRDPKYEEVRWYLRMYLREIDIKRLLRIYNPTIIPVLHNDKLFPQRRLYNNLLALKF